MFESWNILFEIMFHVLDYSYRSTRKFEVQIANEAIEQFDNYTANNFQFSSQNINWYPSQCADF